MGIQWTSSFVYQTDEYALPHQTPALVDNTVQLKLKISKVLSSIVSDYPSLILSLSELM